MRTTAEIRVEIEEHQHRLTGLRGQLAENARIIESKEAARDERIADGGAGAGILNREISELRTEAEGLAGGIARLALRIAGRETELQEADSQERAAECDAAVERGVQSIETIDASIRRFIAEEFTALDAALIGACEAARAAENRLPGTRYGAGRIYEEGWRHHPGLGNVLGALRIFANAATG